MDDSGDDVEFAFFFFFDRKQRRDLLIEKRSTREG